MILTSRSRRHTGTIAPSCPSVAHESTTTTKSNVLNTALVAVLKVVERLGPFATTLTTTSSVKSTSAAHVMTRANARARARRALPNSRSTKTFTPTSTMKQMTSASNQTARALSAGREGTPASTHDHHTARRRDQPTRETATRVHSALVELELDEDAARDAGTRPVRATSAQSAARETPSRSATHPVTAFCSAPAHGIALACCSIVAIVAASDACSASIALSCCLSTACQTPRGRARRSRPCRPPRSASSRSRC